MYIMNSPDLVPKGVLDPTLFWPHASLDFHDRALGKSVFIFIGPIFQAVGKLTTRNAIHDVGRSLRPLVNLPREFTMGEAAMPLGGSTFGRSCKALGQYTVFDILFPFEISNSVAVSHFAIATAGSRDQ